MNLIRIRVDAGTRKGPEFRDTIAGDVRYALEDIRHLNVSLVEVDFEGD